MSNLFPIQPSFAGGELAPSLWGRGDLAKYDVGLRTCENFIIHPHGGVSKRQGMRFITNAKYSDKKCRLVAFQYNLEQSYVLEFGDRYIRFFKDGQPILLNAAPYEIPSPYEEADLFGLSFAQSADVLFICHGDYEIYELSRISHNNWTFEPFKYKNGPFIGKSSIQDDVTVGLSAVSGRVSLTASSALFNAAHEGAIFSVTHSMDEVAITTQGDANGVAIATTLMKRTVSMYGVLTLVIHQLAFFCSQADVAAGYFYSGSKFIVAGISYTVTSVGVAGSNNECRLEVSPALQNQAGNSTTPIAVSVSTSVMNTDTTWGAEVVVYRGWRVESSGFWSGTVFLQRFSKDEDRWTTVKEYYSPSYAEGSATATGVKNYADSGEVNEITGFRLISSNFKAIKPKDNVEADRGYFRLTANEATHTGYAKVISISSPTVAMADMETDAASTTPTRLWQEGAWSAYRGWPSVCGFFQERMVFGNTPSQPQSFWFSRTGDYYDFGLSSPIQDDDPITGTLTARQVSAIREFIPLNDLIVMTATSEWKISSGAAGGVLTPTSIDVKPQGYRGCADIEPIVIGDMILFVQAQASRVRDLGYSFESDSYTGNDLTVLANHLFSEHSIVDWAYQQEPDTMCWVTRNDGLLMSLTYLREHNVIAWARHPLPAEGKAESVACVHSNRGDDVYFVIYRNGIRTVERLSSVADTVPECVFYLDGGVNVNEPNSLSYPLSVNVPHLDGLEVSILADGSVSRCVVADGMVVIPKAASHISIGLAYDATLETLDLNLPRKDGTQFGRKLRITGAVIRVEKTRGLFAGVPGHPLEEQKERSTEPYGAPIRLFTGDRNLRFTSGYDSGRVIIACPYPLPASILAVIPVVDTVDTLR